MLDPSESYQLNGLDELIRNLAHLRNEWKIRLDGAASWKNFHEHKDVMYASFHFIAVTPEYLTSGMQIQVYLQ